MLLFKKGGRTLFSLGAMLVGAGLMFVLIHGEVSADSKPEKFVCSKNSHGTPNLYHCQTTNLDCGYSRHGTGPLFCVKRGMVK